MHTPFNFPGVYYCNVAVVPADSYLELPILLTSGVNTTSFNYDKKVVVAVSILKNGTIVDMNRLSTFVDGVLQATILTTIQVADFDDDGDFDFIFAGTPCAYTVDPSYGSNTICSGYMRLLENREGAFYDFSPLNFLPSGLGALYAGSMEWNDFDRDGRTDFTVTGIPAHTVSGSWQSTSPPILKVYRNGCPAGQHLKGLSCASCPGYVSDDQRSCFPCPKGLRYEAAPDSCTTCPLPLVPSPDQSSCQPCLTTQVYNGSACEDCSPGELGIDQVCQKCPPSQYSDGLVCADCAAGSVQVPSGLECVACP